MLATVLAGTQPRQKLSLNGPWQYRLVEDLSTPVPKDGFAPCDVPGYLDGIDYRRAWFRRTFDVPESMQGMRLKIHFGGVKYNSRVYVNGQEVGGCFGGYRPFEVDVTEAVRFDGPNELLVGCHDWTGIFTPGRVDFRRPGEWHRVRRAPRDKILAPIGGLYGLYGIWDDVTLRAHPAVYVKDRFIKPSMRRGELVVDYTLANETSDDADVELRATVEDQGDDVLRLPPARVHVPAGGTATAIVRRPWPDAHLWSHVDPHLYHLRTELSSGDVERTRFGFREFWVEGHRFYLNGTRINLLATSWWPPRAPMTREEIRERWEAVKRCGCVAFRTHTQPWRTVHSDVADELGLLMIIAGAVWNDESVYRINDPAFWENYAGHLEAMVQRDKNRPSVVMWSLENEFYGGRMNDEAAAKEDLVRMGKLMKQWDPTRPILYESDGDPGGVADVIGIHYPHEYPQYTRWPNEAYWLAEPAEISHMFHDGEEEFLWKKNKPLYIGEFLWLPSRDPSWHTVFFGDEAYVDYRRYRNLGKAASWKMQILGYRHHEVAGISPWTVIEGGPLDETNPLYRAHQYAYQHAAAYCHDYDRRFFSGDEVKRRVEVFNDVMQSSDLTLECHLVLEQKIADRAVHPVKLGPAESRMIDVLVNMPQVGRRTPVTWKLSLVRDGRTVFDDAHDYVVLPRVRLPQVGARIGLYDPEGTTGGVFQAAGLPTTPVERLDDLDGEFDVLVIGADALGRAGRERPIIGQVLPERAALVDFAARGGRVLVLGQEAYPAGLFDVSLSDHGSTMTFAARPRHPALEGVLVDDLKFWRGDHIVAASEPVRPASGAAVPIVVSGSAAGIDHAPLLERPIGRGAIVHCQMKLVEKYATEPAAARILANLLRYLADFDAAPRKTALVGGSEPYRLYLASLGLRFEDLPETLAEADPSRYSLLLCRGAVGDASKLAEFLRPGGNVVVHRPSPDGLDSLNRALGLDLVEQPYAGHVTRAEGDRPMLGAVTREDLYWLGEHVGIGWSTTPRAGEMVDGLFTRSLEGKRPQSYEVEGWELEGQIVERREPGVAFATVGSASAEIDFPKTGTYVIGLVARGTPCEGVYPVARVAVDGQRLGDVPVWQQDWHTATTFGRVEKGRHDLSVAFTNDGSDPPREDRNLYVDKVLVAHDDGGDRVDFLTTPPAVAVTRCGKGTLVVDQVRWDTEERNARKAARYASSLLTALGGDFPPRLGVTVECENMEPQPDMPHFHDRGTFVSLACNGYVKTPIEVAAAGRYTVQVVASGSRAAGVFPIVEVRVDRKPVGQVQLATTAWRPYVLQFELTEGTHELALAFTNDYNRDGEDRNVRLDQVLFCRE
jgi:hypothetical protein